MALYKGTAADAARASRLAKVREEQKKEYEKLKESMKDESKVGLKDMAEMFQSKEAHYEEQFKASTIGLVSASDFKKKRQYVENLMLAEKQQKEDAIREAKKRKERERKAKLTALSFDLEQEEQVDQKLTAIFDYTTPNNTNYDGNTKIQRNSDSDSNENEIKEEEGVIKREKGSESDQSKSDESDPSDGDKQDSDAVDIIARQTLSLDSKNHDQHEFLKLLVEQHQLQQQQDEQQRVRKKFKKLTKNPDVDTSFLPDRERELYEANLRKKLEAKWKELQEKVKNEVIEVTYSYWDGSGHRRSIKVTKGTRVDQFLEKCRRELCEAFHELRGVSSENLVYVKEDLIIPHHYTFYDLIVSKARGKSGPLFHFDVHDDVRLLTDASVEKDESHAGKIVTRGWYERNQHIFPASRWEVYDPSVKRDKYTIKGK